MKKITPPACRCGRGLADGVAPPPVSNTDGFPLEREGQFPDPLRPESLHHVWETTSESSRHPQSGSTQFFLAHPGCGEPGNSSSLIYARVPSLPSLSQGTLWLPAFFVGSCQRGLPPDNWRLCSVSVSDLTPRHQMTRGVCGANAAAGVPLLIISCPGPRIKNFFFNSPEIVGLYKRLGPPTHTPDNAITGDEK